MYRNVQMFGVLFLVQAALLFGCGDRSENEAKTSVAKGEPWFVGPSMPLNPSVERTEQIKAEAAAVRKAAISEYQAKPSDLTRLRLAAAYFLDLSGHFKESQETHFRISPQGISMEAIVEPSKMAPDGSSWSRPGKEKRLMAKLPLRACDPFILSSRGHDLEVRRLNAGCEGAQVGLFKGAVIYGNTYVTASSERVEEFTVIDSPAGQLLYAYEVKPSSGIRAIRDAQEYLEFLDASNTPIMRLHYAVAQSAASERRKARLNLEGVERRQGFQQGRFAVYELRSGTVRVSMNLSLSGLAGPVVVDPGWSSTGSLAIARYQHSTTLLPSGEVLVSGGYDGSVIPSCELYDPTSGTWAATGSLATGRQFPAAILLPAGKVLAVGGASTAELYDPASGTWSTTGSPTIARSAPTTTLLSSGIVLMVGGWVGSYSPLCELYDPASGTWSETGSLATGRYGHTSSLLSTGKVLVAGGHGTTSVLSSSELYDPDTGNWSATGFLANARSDHAATLLPSGQVLVAGGFNFGGLNTSELYDEASGNWSVAGSLEMYRYDHTATLLPSGQVLVAGGWGGANTFSPAELYDSNSGAWSTTSSLAMGRFQHTATLLSSGSVLVVGGADQNYNVLSSTEIYHPGAGAWAPTDPVATWRNMHTATLIPSGKVLVVGGSNLSGNLSSSELYDPALGTWSETGSMASLRTLHTATLLPSGKVLVVGGKNGSDLSSCELYDLASGIWSATGALTTARGNHTATLLFSGRVLVAGGGDEGYFFSSSELYDPASGAWFSTDSLATGRVSPTATQLLSGKVLVAGGYNLQGLISSCELYDPASGRWSPTGSLVNGRNDHTATLLPSGKVLVVGGYGDSGYLSSSELYDPEAGAWSLTGSLTTKRWRHAATLLPSGKVLVAGGSNVPDGTLYSSEVFDPASGAWSAADPLANPRDRHTATLLPSGRVLVVGSDFSSSEVYDESGAQDAWRPVITNVPARIEPDTSYTVTGSNFRGISEASGGSYQSSATDFPLIMLVGPSGRNYILPSRDFSATSATFTTPASSDLPGGYYMLFVMTNALESEAKIVLALAEDGTSCSSEVECISGFCASGVCCDRACDGECDQACNLPGDVGKCVVLPETTPCDDSIFCNGAGTCDSFGTCIHAGNPCLGLPACKQTCDEQNDRCQDPDGSPCTDGLDCTDDQCQSGACQSTANDQNCNDNIVCTNDRCDAVLGCQHTPDNGLCPDDGLFCNGAESCDVFRGCVHGVTPCAASGLACDENTDQCVLCLQNQDCDDGIFCNGAEQCGSDGNCVAGTSSCDDGDVCTLDQCDEGTDQCSHMPDPQCPGGQPEIACQPNLKATVGLRYLYDQDGRIEATGTQPMVWAKFQGPEALHIDPINGVITWIPESQGSAQIQIQASNDQGNDICAFEVQVAPEASGIPQAMMEISPEMGKVPLQVHLDGSSSIAPAGGNIVSYRWDFGDGSGWGYGPVQDHLFSTAGSYRVGLLVTEGGGSSDQTKGLVRVQSLEGKKPPVAKIVASASVGEGSLIVDFSCACVMGDAPIIAYAWDFADQSQSDLAAVQHNFLVGRYEVKLMVLDDNGLSGTDRQEIVVTPGGSKKLPPECQGSGAPLSGVAPLEVSYIGFYADSDGLVTEWKWYFGEEEVTGQADLSRTYSLPGIFDARFVVTDNDSLTCQSSVEVVVSQTPGKTPPKILSLPTKTAKCNEVYQYDKDNKPSARGDRPIFWKLGKEINGQILGKPEGMEINAQTGEIAWTPSGKQAGANNVTLIVSNDQGADVQEFEVEAACTDQPSEGCGCGGAGGERLGVMNIFWLAIGLLLRQRTFKRHST